MTGAVRGIAGRLADGWRGGVAAARRRSAVVDHAWLAGERYQAVYGERLAAAIAYYGFFAAFALTVLGFAVLGLVLRGNEVVTGMVERYLQRNLPQLSVATLVDTARDVGWLAAGGLTLAGVRWVQTLRSSQRAIWGLVQRPGNPVLRWLVDVGVLAGLGLLLIVSICVSSGAQDLLLHLAGQAEQSTLRVALRESTLLIAATVDLVLAAALLAWVPRLRMPLRRLAPSVVLVVAGLALLKTAGRGYVELVQHNPAYQVVAGAVGLLIFMYLFNQLVLFAAAFAATGRTGRVVDLADAPGGAEPWNGSVGTVRSGRSADGSARG